MANLYRRGRVWYIRFQYRGREFRESTGSRVRAEAQRFLDRRREELRTLARGGIPRYGFDQAMSRFIEEHCRALKPSAAYRYVVSARVLSQHFRDKYLDEIGRAALSGFVTDRRKAVTAATVKRDLACLGSMYARAIEWGWAENNPVRAFRGALREAPARTRFLSPDEYKALRKAATGDLAAIVTVAVETGMRLGEILGMTWRDIDFDRREIRVTESKTSSPRTVPMSEIVRAQLSAHRRHAESPLVFCWPNGRGYRTDYISKQFHKLTEKAEIRDFRFHDLRHTFASWAVQRGADTYRVQRILGHKSAQMMQRYAHLRTEDLHEVVTKSGT